MADISILFTFSHNSIEISHHYSIVLAFGLLRHQLTILFHKTRVAYYQIPTTSKL